eukprot:4673110-Pleurochrysis_carterae.AAC.3
MVGHVRQEGSAYSPSQAAPPCGKERQALAPSLYWAVRVRPGAGAAKTSSPCFDSRRVAQAHLPHPKKEARDDPRHATAAAPLKAMLPAGDSVSISYLPGPCVLSADSQCPHHEIRPNRCLSKLGPAKQSFALPPPRSPTPAWQERTANPGQEPRLQTRLRASLAMCPAAAATASPRWKRERRPFWRNVLAQDLTVTQVGGCHAQKKQSACLPRGHTMNNRIDAAASLCNSMPSAVYHKHVHADCTGPHRAHAVMQLPTRRCPP